MMRRKHLGGLFIALLVPVWALAQPGDNIGHERHKVHHGESHPTEAPTPARFVTTRKSDIVLPLPQEKDAFTFAIFGDRTGGPVDGVKVLADAVHDVNLLEPDLVMTVGDLVNGYNATDKWLEQMREFKGIMNELRCPWFPVAGNHDIYMGNTPGKPRGEHEKEYEVHFGPLWYAFEHKKCWFVALYSDEGNPQTGEKAFNKPEAQRMSEEQFEWLKGVLQKAKDAEHVFLFLHHPRWLGGNYGDDWERVHKLLVSAGNVTAVFAGHIHRMRSDPRDGIEYVTLATVGGAQDGIVADAGWLHQYHIITVRKGQVAMASIPVGEVMDVRELTGQLADECAKMTREVPVVQGAVRLRSDASAEETVRVVVANPTSREAEVTVMLESADPRWIYAPDHEHQRVAPGTNATLEFEVRRPADMADGYMRRLEAVVDAQVLMPGHRYALPTRRVRVPVMLEALPMPSVPAQELALSLGGHDAARVENAAFDLPDGPFTVECWVNAEAFAQRTGLICKTEDAEYGLFVNAARPEFMVFLGRGYAAARAAQPILKVGRWHHLAGVFDGAEVRLYVDGVKVAAVPGKGERKRNHLPLVIGADVSANGGANSFFKGKLDGVRVSKGAVYAGDKFEPARRLSAEAGTVLLTNMDALVAGGVWLEVPRGTVGELVGAPGLVGE